MFKPAWLLFFASVSSFVQADFFEGTSAYQHQDYQKAQQEFSELLVLGNGAAVFNLAIMAYQGQGERADPIKTAALLTLAAELGEQKALATAAKMTASLDASQQHDMKNLLAEYQAMVQISPEQRGWAHRTKDRVVQPRPTWLKKVPPVFPNKAQLNGHFGAVSMLALLDTDGSVIFVDSNETLGRDLFSKAAKSSFLKWQFAPLPQRQIYRMTYDFSYNLPVAEQRNTRLTSWKALQQKGLLEMVQQDSAAHQFALGKILQRLEQSTEVEFFPDESLIVTQAIPDRMIYQVAKTPQRLDPLLEEGSLILEVNAENRIVTLQTYTGSPLHERSKLATLKGTTLSERVPAGWYKLVYQRDSNGVESNYLWDLQRIPLEHYSGYWISLAARNGDLNAQRELASYRSDWRQYLQQKNDPKGLLWAGMLALQNGNDQQAKSLLLQAKAAGESQVDELLKAVKL